MADLMRFVDDWEFRFDAVDGGVIEQWHRRKPSELRKVRVPHLFSQEQNPDNAFIGFYFKEFTLDKKEVSKRFLIRIHAAYPHCTVWLNGEELTTANGHFCGQAGFDLEASRHVKIGEPNLLVIRIQSPDRQGKIQDMIAAELPLGAPYLRGAYAGLLGPVDLVPGQKAVIRAVSVLPDYEADRITVETRFLNGKSFGSDVSFDITNPEGETTTLVKNVRLDRENSMFSLNLQFENSKVWSPNSPTLYTMAVSLPGTSTVKFRFGMRSAEVEKGSFKLNRASLKIRGVGFPWSFPFQNGIPAFPVDVRKELKALKDAGFNLIRGSGAPLPPEVLDACDEIGLLVLQETSCFNQKSSKEGLEWTKAQIRELVERDGHHPSLFGWVIGSDNGSLVLENGNKLLRYTSELDPTRPVFSNLGSVYLDGHGGGKIDLGKVFEPMAAQIAPFEGHKTRLSYPVSQRSYAMLSGYCSSKEGRAIADGVHGNKSFWERYNYLKDEIAGKVLVDGLGVPAYGSIPELLEATKKFSSSADVKELNKWMAELNLGIKERDLSFWKDAGEFLAAAETLGRNALTRQIEALLTNPQVSGYVIETFSDQGLRFTGLTNWMRAPKPALMEALKRVNQTVYVFTEPEDRTPYTGSSASIKVHLFNEGHLGDYSLNFKVKGPNGRSLHQETQNGKAKPGINAATTFKFPVGFERGRFIFELSLIQKGREITRYEETLFVPPEVKLNSLLKKVSLLGNFPDTVSYSTTDEAPITVATGLSEIPADALKKAIHHVEDGAALILGALTDEDVRLLNATKALGFEVACLRSAGGPQGNFHYIKPGAAFKDLPAPGLMDQNYADVQPVWSLEPVSKAEIHAGSINFTTVPGSKSKIRWGMDVAVIPHGKGKVVFCQYDLFGKLGKNAMADALFNNLINLTRQ